MDRDLAGDRGLAHIVREGKTIKCLHPVYLGKQDIRLLDNIKRIFVIEILFILGFSLHNIEEALWLPEWSKSAGRYQKEISANGFRFAVIIITALGYLVTFQYFIFSETYMFSKLLYLSFVAMMVLNVILPHLLLTIIMGKYAPGLITGVLLNLPIGLYLIIKNIDGSKEILGLCISTIILSITILILIRVLFRIGKRIFD